MKMRIIKGSLAMALALVSFVPAVSMAAAFRADKSGSVSVIEEVNDDLYAAGSTVSIGSGIKGDAIMAGGTVIVSGGVDQSVLAAGGNVSILGNVADDVRIVGGNMNITGKVAHDVVAIGGQIAVTSGASVGGDLVAFGGSVVIDGPVSGDVLINAGDIVINAPISGSAKLAASAVSFGPNASIGGRLVYSSPDEAQIASGLAKGGVEYKKIEVRSTESAKSAISALVTIGLFFKLLAAFLLAVILTAIFKKRALAMTQAAYAQFGWNMLYGFAALILAPIAAITLLATVIGAPFALVVMCAFGIVMMLAGILAPMLVGSLIWKMIKKTKDYPVNTYSILVGVIAFVFIGLIPLLGWIFCFAFMLVALGAFARALFGGLKKAQ